MWVADTHDGKVLSDRPGDEQGRRHDHGRTDRQFRPELAGKRVRQHLGRASRTTRSIVRIDPNTNKVQATIKIPVEVTPCGSFAFTATDVWTQSCGGRATMARIDPATNAVAGVIRPAGPASAPVVIDGAAWVSVDTTPVIPGYLARLSAEQDAVDFGAGPGPRLRRRWRPRRRGRVRLGRSMAANDRVLRLPLSGFTPG